MYWDVLHGFLEFFICCIHEKENIMSTYNESKPSKPFKTVMVEYFEDFNSNDKKALAASRPWKLPVAHRRIRVVTTTCDYNLGSSKGDPIVSVTYEYL